MKVHESKDLHRSSRILSIPDQGLSPPQLILRTFNRRGYGWAFTPPTHSTKMHEAQTSGEQHLSRAFPHAGL